MVLAYGEVPHGSYGSEKPRVEREHLVKQLTRLAPGATSQWVVLVVNVGELELSLEVIGIVLEYGAVLPLCVVRRAAVERAVCGQKTPIPVAESGARRQGTRYRVR